MVEKVMKETNRDQGKMREHEWSFTRICFLPTPAYLKLWESFYFVVPVVHGSTETSALALDSNC